MIRVISFVIFIIFMVALGLKREPYINKCRESVVVMKTKCSSEKRSLNVI